jgi:hypothetical protein
MGERKGDKTRRRRKRNTNPVAVVWMIEEPGFD